MRLTGDAVKPDDLARVASAIVSGRSNVPFDVVDSEGNLQGPFACMPFSPQLGHAFQEVGSAIRMHTSLSKAQVETAILAVARHWKSSYEWYAHERVVRAGGLLDEADLVRIGAGGAPRYGDLAAVWLLASESLAGVVAETTTADAIKVLGERGAVEVVMIVGYYTSLAMMIAAFDTPVPEVRSYPWDEPR